MEKPMTLDDLGILHGTDKTSLFNDYLQAYEDIFSPFRDRAITLWEIGVAEGGSLKVWSEYFPKAQILGIDNNPQCKQYESARVQVSIGSQDDPEFLADLFRDATPDIIIDDGSHRADHIQFTFDRLFPVLAAGGLYVIEDLWLHAGNTAAQTRGRAAVTVPEFIGALAGRLMVRRIEAADDGGLPGYLFRTIDRVQLISGAVVISKKQAPSPVPLWEKAYPVIEKSGHPINWYYLSTHILHNRGPLDIAVAVMRKAVAQDPGNPTYRLRLADCLERSGSLGEAISVAEEAIKLAGDEGAASPYRDFLASLLRKRQSQPPGPEPEASHSARHERRQD
jgi:tetratricopeptide (TPR) repeat protein